MRQHQTGMQQNFVRSRQNGFVLRRLVGHRRTVRYLAVGLGSAGFGGRQACPLGQLLLGGGRKLGPDPHSEVGESVVAR
jgi:hypothetical protein